MVLIGLDAASDPENFGYAIGRWTRGTVHIESTGVLGLSPCLDEGAVPQPDVSEILGVMRRSERGLVAVDAPLGWPMAMGSALATHQAGDFIAEARKENFFRRRTDRLLRERGMGNPLEVGADRIARATHQALNVLHKLGSSMRPVPLAWSVDFPEWAVIEVYPAATLKARGAPFSKYKRPSMRGVRLQIAHHPDIASVLPQLSDRVDAIEHVFDACLCLLAAADFLLGEVAYPAPDDLDAARKEGWIWCRRPT